MNVLKTSKYMLGSVFAAFILSSCAKVPQPTELDIKQGFLRHWEKVEQERLKKFHTIDSVEAKRELANLPKDASSTDRFNAQRKVDLATGKLLNEAHQQVLHYQQAVDSLERIQREKKAAQNK